MPKTRQAKQETEPPGPGETGHGEKPRPGRPRQADLDQRLESAVLALLHDGGPSIVTVEAVANKAGVAKTSIYRRYANRGELLTAARADRAPGGRAGGVEERSGVGAIA